jgi:hypothetical protein
MYYKLIRHTLLESFESKDGNRHDVVIGTLYKVHHYFNHRTGVTVEVLTPLCDTMEFADSMILPLVYRVDVTRSSRLGRLTPNLHQVPGHDDIRIHTGRSRLSDIYVTLDEERKLTKRWYREKLTGEETRLEIGNLWRR